MPRLRLLPHDFWQQWCGVAIKGQGLVLPINVNIDGGETFRKTENQRGAAWVPSMAANESTAARNK